MKIALLSIFALLPLGIAAMAQDTVRPETVTWSVAPAQSAKPGAKVALVLQGKVQNGWHVYSLQQKADGPTPLLVGLASNDIAKADGKVTESAPEKVRDAAFGFDTAFFAKPFTITVPVRLKPGAKAGAQTIPLNVRFQTCSGGTCQPPKTVHLSAAVTVGAR